MILFRSLVETSQFKPEACCSQQRALSVCLDCGRIPLPPLAVRVPPLQTIWVFSFCLLGGFSGRPERRGEWGMRRELVLLGWVVTRVIICNLLPSSMGERTHREVKGLRSTRIGVVWRLVLWCYGFLAFRTHQFSWRGQTDHWSS